MRRSKSDPAKYARNYRKISQRRMTESDDLDEDKEIERLRSLLRTFEKHLQHVEEPSNSAGVNGSGKKKRRRKGDGYDHEHGGDTINSDNHDATTGLLSEELLAQGAASGLASNCDSENPLIVLPNSSMKKKLKKDKTVTVVPLTPEEIRDAKALQKKTARKLQQLETRAAQKKKRAELYKRLEESNKVSRSVALQPLLASSGKLSRKESDTKKQALKRILNKERAGLALTAGEKDLLYPERTVQESFPMSPTHDSDRTGQESFPMSPTHDSDKMGQSVPKDRKDTEDMHKIKEEETDDKIDAVLPKEVASSSKTPASGFDFAAQMMASLSKLTEESKITKEEVVNKTLSDLAVSVEPGERYIPTNPTVVKTAATMGLQPSSIANPGHLTRIVVEINRPPDVEKTRMDLPVTAMEYEIMDAIQSNDVTIICSETGSGKSTQIPAYLYEAGMSYAPGSPETTFLIGITQPRRVAAVSTAKRVCYEMGQGDGHTIRGKNGNGNLVAYKTRYEAAGTGKATRIQFMTDGILLSEIQSDLLLRRYSVIVLDESHERNLNTDVLIGLLSKTLPLRKKAAEEDPSLVPLKLILMSATLRVEDFTKNEMLFPTGPPAVVTVPGRTHPVTVHHSKITELDDYENAAFRKICKIHRKLPYGGILVFLTGKTEIIRMVNKLRRAFKESGKQGKFRGNHDVTTPASDLDVLNAPREMDDEDLDAEEVDNEEFDELDRDEDDFIIPDPEDDAIPKHTFILPLYSLLSAEEQANVFAPVPDGHRLIVVATNIAETSITIPGISYVVDTGRQKCRNYNSGTGIASYDVMWISKASADQRAGRAGRTGPGHCYRLYSSSLYDRHMDPFALPEVLTRPLEDVVLSMKAMKISDVASFPFPTPPDRSQIDAAINLLANIGCVDVSNVDTDCGDGVVTRLGQAVSKLPLGVRYSKMLLVAAQAGILDYAIVLVAVLSESSPFTTNASSDDKVIDTATEDDSDLDEIDKVLVEEKEKGKKKIRNKWFHSGGDVLASILAVGAYTYAGRGAGGSSEALANRTFCEENGLNTAIMGRIQKMRKHLAGIAKNRLSAAGGVASITGGFSSKMSPPNKLQERLLIQSIASGLLDHVAVLATPGSLSGEHPMDLRSAYITCSSTIKDPLFLDRSSSTYTRDYRQLPRWVCYDSIVRKATRDGTSIAVMKNITPIDPSWLGEISKGTKLLSFGPPLPSPPPSYDAEQDAVLCSVTTKFGSHGWEIPPLKKIMYDVVTNRETKQTSDFLPDDSFRWFGRFLLEGKVITELSGLDQFLNDSPGLITRRAPSSKVTILVSTLYEAGIDSAAALRKHWAEKDDKLLFKQLKGWIRRDDMSQAKRLWIEAVRKNVKTWNDSKKQ